MTVKQAGMSLFSLQTCFKEFPFFTRGVRTDKTSHASFSSSAFVCSEKTYGARSRREQSKTRIPSLSGADIVFLKLIIFLRSQMLWNINSPIQVV